MSPMSPRHITSHHVTSAWSRTHNNSGVADFRTTRSLATNDALPYKARCLPQSCCLHRDVTRRETSGVWNPRHGVICRRNSWPWFLRSNMELSMHVHTAFPAIVHLRPGCYTHPCLAKHWADTGYTDEALSFSHSQDRACQSFVTVLLLCSKGVYPPFFPFFFVKHPIR